MKALVLSGGAVKGAYQAGAMTALASKGFIPDLIVGTSVGALNTLYLTSEMGKGLSFYEAAVNLEAFWKSNVTTQDALLKQRNKFSIAWNILSGDWKGFVDMSPLKKLIDKHIDPKAVRECKTRGAVSVASLSDGTIHYWLNTNLRFPEMAFVSGMEPVVMPTEGPYCDGGVREIAPLRYAIDMGAGEVVLIACQPEQVAFKHWREINSAMRMIARVLDILTNEIVNNDIDVLTAKNSVKGKKKIALTVIRPDNPLNVDIMKFTRSDIHAMITQGSRDASTSYQST